MTCQEWHWNWFSFRWSWWCCWNCHMATRNMDYLSLWRICDTNYGTKVDCQEFKLKVEQGLMGLFVKLGVVGELNHKTVCSFHSIYHLIVSRRCYLEEAPAYNHRAFSIRFWPIVAFLWHWMKGWSGLIFLIGRGEESEWRWRDTCAQFRVFAPPHLTPPLPTPDFCWWSRAGHGHNP